MINNTMMRFVSSTVLVICLVACGGGGGGSSAAPPAASTGGGSTGGGSTGGGSTSAVFPDGLASGGVGVLLDVSFTGVELEVQGGGSGAPVSGITLGDIQGFSSVILNDNTINTDSATFLLEGESGAQSDLKQGQQVLVTTDTNGAAVEVVYRANVKGPVTSVNVIDADLGQASVEVLGQAIGIDGTTTFSNGDLAGIVVGTLLEVSGVVDEAGGIRASFIELNTTLQEYKVLGTVSSSTATTFNLGALNVDYSSATLSEFEGASIADGDIVEVKGAPAGFTAPDQFVADEVERLPTLTIGESAAVQLEGLIDRFVSGSDFDVQSAAITTDGNTVFVNGDVSSLALNVKVQLEGVQTGDAILAGRITIQPTNTVRAEGNVEAVDLVNNTIDVLGVRFVLRDLTRLEDDSSVGVDPFTLADLGIGDEVRVRGYLDGSTVVATRVEREDSEPRSRLRGPVTAEDAAGGVVEILGVTVTGQTGITDYEDLSGSVISQAEFHQQLDVNEFVRATWDNFVDTNQVADELSIED